MELAIGATKETPSVEDDKEKLMTVDEVAAFLQVKKKTVYAWVSDQRMPCFRINKRILRFLKERVIEWLATYEQKGRRAKRILPS